MTDTRVTVVCPTYNRQHLLPCLIRQFLYQSYPQAQMSLVILDDSEKPWTCDIPPNVRYVYSETRMTLCEKRQKLNSLVSDDTAVIVCFDDDDFSFPDRVKKSVHALRNNRRKWQIAGSSEMLVYDTATHNVHKVGPFGVYHATNGTLAYTREYARSHTYVQTQNDKGEESHFMNFYREPLVQLNPYDTILCVNHGGNAVPKNMFLTIKNKLSATLTSLVPHADKFTELWDERWSPSMTQVTNGVRAPNITVSMTTTPVRLKHLPQTVASILSQTLLPTCVQINVPHVCERYPEDTYDEDELRAVTKLFANSLVMLRIVRCKDYGPITKLVPTLQDCTTDYILTIDDDIVYPEQMIEHLYMAANDSVATGISGFVIDRKTAKLLPVNRQTYVHVLEGYAGVLYPARAFAQRAKGMTFMEYIDITSEKDKNCRFSDDIIISNWLALCEYMKMQVYTLQVNRRRFWKDGCVLTRGDAEDALHNGAAGFTTNDNTIRYLDVFAYLESEGLFAFWS